MKRLKVLLGAMLLTATMVGGFAFTSKDFHRPFATACFEYTGVNTPTDPQATDPASYTSEDPAVCSGIRQTLCAICFDDASGSGFPLNTSGQPDFDNQPVLRSLVEDNKTNFAQHGNKIFAPDGRWVRLYFRPLNP